jgi:hypothetical protein
MFIYNTEKEKETETERKGERVSLSYEFSGAHERNKFIFLE